MPKRQSTNTSKSKRSFPKVVEAQEFEPPSFLNEKSDSVVDDESNGFEHEGSMEEEGSGLLILCNLCQKLIF